MKKKLFSIILKIIVSLIFFFILLNIVEPKELFQTFLKINISLFFLALFLEPLVILFTALIYKLIIAKTGKKIKFSYIFKTSALTYALGYLAPSKLGELGIVFPLKKAKIQIKTGITIFIYEKLLSFIFFGILISYAAFRYLNQFLFYSAIICSLITIILVILVPTKINKFDNKFYKKLLKDYKLFILTFTLKILKWILSFIILYLIFLSFNTQINFISMILVYSLVGVISAIPITFAGIGIQETTGTVFYNFFLGISETIAANVLIFQTFKNLIMAFLYFSFTSNMLFNKKK